MDAPINRTFGKGYRVEVISFPAGEYHIVKEVIISDQRISRTRTKVRPRTYFRLDPTLEQTKGKSPYVVLNLSRSFTRLSALCEHFGIDPVKAAFPKA